MDETTPDIELTPDQIHFYNANGYLAIDRITSDDDIAFMRTVYDCLFEEKAGWTTGDYFDLAGNDEDDAPTALPQILTPTKYAPELQDTLLRVNALAIAQQLLGPEAYESYEHAILKPAHQGVPTPWHQDEAYANPDLEYTTVNIWVPLQEVTPENGCMQFIPGSNDLDVLPHHCINNDPRIVGLEVDGPIDTTAAVACPLPAGGATFHAKRTLHYTGPNRSDSPRRAYVLMYSLPTRPSPVKRVFYWNEQKQTARQVRAAASSAT